MQILRIILMVCFVFTAYTPIGEAVDISKRSKKKSSSRAELPLDVEDIGAFESKENQGGSPIELEGAVAPSNSGGSPIELEGNEQVELEAGFDYEDPGATADGSLEVEPHLNERILQLQKKEFDKSLDTPTEDDRY